MQEKLHNMQIKNMIKANNKPFQQQCLKLALNQYRTNVPLPFP